MSVKVNVRLPDELAMRIDAIMVASGRSRSDVMVDAMRAGLDRKTEPRRAPAKPKPATPAALVIADEVIQPPEAADPTHWSKLAANLSRSPASQCPHGWANWLRCPDCNPPR